MAFSHSGKNKEGHWSSCCEWAVAGSSESDCWRALWWYRLTNSYCWLTLSAVRKGSASLNQCLQEPGANTLGEVEGGGALNGQCLILNFVKYKAINIGIRCPHCLWILILFTKPKWLHKHVLVNYGLVPRIGTAAQPPSWILRGNLSSRPCAKMLQLQKTHAGSMKYAPNNANVSWNEVHTTLNPESRLLLPKLLWQLPATDTRLLLREVWNLWGCLNWCL